MRILIASTIAAVATVAVFSAPSFADTKTDDEQVFHKVTVNKADKTHLARAGHKTYRSQNAFRAFDSRYKVHGQGKADRR